MLGCLRPVHSKEVLERFFLNQTRPVGVDRTLVRVRSLRYSASGQLLDPDQRPVSTDQTRPVKKIPLWNLSGVDRMQIPSVRSTFTQRPVSTR